MEFFYIFLLIITAFIIYKIVCCMRKPTKVSVPNIKTVPTPPNKKIYNSTKRTNTRMRNDDRFGSGYVEDTFNDTENFVLAMATIQTTTVDMPDVTEAYTPSSDDVSCGCDSCGD